MSFRTASRLGSLFLAAVLCLGHADDGGCGGDEEQEQEHEHEGVATGATCPPSGGPTAQSFGTAFMQTYCVNCHSASLMGVARQGAPAEFNFDTVEQVRLHASHIDTHAAAGPNGTNTEMPPVNKQPQPTQQEREQLGQWLACGAP